MLPGAIRLTLIVSGVAVSAFAQNANPNTIVGAGYLYPAPISLAPGQVITIFAAGVGRGLTQPVFAGSGKLPASLAGIGVTLVQETNLAVPILSVVPAPNCDCGLTAAITIQVSYELYQPPANGLATAVELFVTENGVAGKALIVNPVPAQVHILTICDTIIGGSGPSTGRCPWEVTHADGTLVSTTSPAKVGEELVAYAVGLGATTPAVPTGQAATQPTSTTQKFPLAFNFQADAPPSAPPSTQTNPAPLFTGLASGYPGLYQINFTVPSAPPGLPPCAGQGPDFVNTNFTVSIGSAASFDGAELCVLLPN